MIQIAIMGLGTVGTGVAKVVAENARQIERKLGEPLQVKTILVRHFKDGPYRQLMTDDFTKIEEDHAIRVVVETIGGVEAAYEYTKRALNAGKHVVTANKQLVAEKGAELLALAKKRGVNYLFEASVGQYQFQRALRKILLHRTDDIRNAPVRAGTQHGHFSALFQHQRQFVRKGIGLFPPFRPREEVFKMRIFLIRNGQLRKDKHAAAQFSNLIHKTETGAVQSIGLHHSVFPFILELRLEEFSLADNLCLVVHGKKVMQSAGVVAMSVRQYQEIHLLQVNPKYPGIAYEKVGSSGIEQQAMLTRINKQGKPVLSL